MKGLYFILALGTAACAPAHDALERRDSRVSAAIAVSDRLQKEEDLLYRLLCAETSDMELVEVARLAVLKGTVQTDLLFTLDYAIEMNSLCRLEIRALSTGTFAQGADYEFLAENDVFYVSAKAPVVKSEIGVGATADMPLYKVYRDINFDHKPVATELSFPVGTEGSFKFKLICASDKTYAAMATITAAAPVFKAGFKIPYKDLDKPLSCTSVTAVNDDASVTLKSVFSPELQISKKTAAAIVTDMTLETPPNEDAVPETP